MLSRVRGCKGGLWLGAPVAKHDSIFNEAISLCDLNGSLLLLLDYCCSLLSFPERVEQRTCPEYL